MFAWNGAYLENLSLDRQLRFITSTSAEQVREAWLAKLEARRILDEHPARQPRSEQEILKQYAALPATSIFAYSFRNTDRNGDMRNTCASKLHTPVGPAAYLDRPAISYAPVRLLEQAVDELELRGVSTFVVYPPMIREADIGGALRRGVRAFARTLVDAGLPILGTPDTAMFPISMFFDSSYHLNCEGRLARTRAVAGLLETALRARF